jgi:hypothetical protein
VRTINGLGPYPLETARHRFSLYLGLYSRSEWNCFCMSLQKISTHIMYEYRISKLRM